jgi:hypothetical protein
LKYGKNNLIFDISKRYSANIYQMAKQLTKDAREAIQNDPELFAQVCAELEVKPGSLISALNKNSRRLTEHGVVVLISKKIGIRPTELTEDAPVSTNTQTAA